MSWADFVNSLRAYSALRIVVDFFRSVSSWFSHLSRAVRAPICAGGWLIVNLLLCWRGAATGHMNRYFISAGVINGIVLAVLVVSLASEKFQTTILGFISGVSIDNISSQQTLAQKAIKAFADFLHNTVHQLLISLGGTDAANSVTEQQVEQAIIFSACATAGVILLALIVNWISSLLPGNPPSPPPAPQPPTLPSVPNPLPSRGDD